MAKHMLQTGDHFIVGLAGSELSKTEATLLKTLQPLGIILFAHNIDKAAAENWPAKLKRLIADAKTASKNEQLLVSVDHEGDRVHRFPDPVTRFPAGINWKENAAAVATAMARELRALDINLSYAPVLDVWHEAKNTVIGRRAFGKTPEEVTPRALAFLQALEQAGVLGCGKHFPGHGGTVADSHNEMPRLDASRAELDNCDIKPFQALIKQGLHLLMTSHVLYPALDEAFPATCSVKILNNLLRKELGFSGVVITDALDMRALARMTDIEKALRFMQASGDVLLVAQPKVEIPATRALEMAAAIAVESSLKASLEQSQRRIATLKLYQQQIQTNASRETCDLNTLGCAAHIKLCKNLSNAIV